MVPGIEHTHPSSKPHLTAQLWHLSRKYVNCVFKKHNKEHTVSDGNSLPALYFPNLPHSSQWDFIYMQTGAEEGTFSAKWDSGEEVGVQLRHTSLEMAVRHPLGDTQESFD